MLRRDLAQTRLFDSTPGQGVWAARVEVTARGRGQGRGDFAYDRNETLPARFEPGHFGQQRLGIGMVGPGEDLPVVALSTTRPRYMISTRSEMCCTTPRSWLIKR